MLRKGLWALALALCATWTEPSTARSEDEVRWSKQQIYSSALRYLRVDLGYTVTEKDAEAAYLMFEFPRSDQKKKLAFGSIEIVDMGKAVRLVVRLPELPEYRERLLADGLLSKLKNEHGEPPAPAKPEADDKAKKPKDDKKPPTAPGPSP
jgi:hypothetical protein